MIQRKVYAEVPLRVEYSITDIGKSLSPILDAMHTWGAKYLMKNVKTGTKKGRDNAATATKAEVALV